MSNPLFAPGADWRLNACLNWGIDTWYAYSEGYRRAAEVVTEYVRQTHQDQDVLIYPVLFLWRHHLELKLKAIARSASQLLGEDWTPPGDHDLGPLFAVAHKLAERCYSEFAEKVPNAELLQAKAALASLKAVDARAMAFRYPEDLKGNKHLEGPYHINFDVVERHMTAISEALDNVESALAIFHDWQSEAYSSY